MGIVIIFIVAKVLNKAGARIIHACFHRRKLPFGQTPDARLDTTSTLMISIWRYVVYFFAIIAILGVLGLGQAATSLLATAGMSLVDWEASWAESGTALAVGILVAAVVALAALLVIKKTGGKRAAVD